MYKYISIFFLLIPKLLISQVVLSGYIKDVGQNPIAYANVFLKPGFSGTTSNDAGFYRIEVKPGNYTLQCQYLGYKLFTKNINIDSTAKSIDIVLENEMFQISEVMIKSSAEDPAYEMVRKTIANRKTYLNQVQAYSCNVYIKGVQRLFTYPEKFLGKTVDFGGLVDSSSGIFYLSESVSSFNFEKPNKIREEMISSRISGNNRAFSYNKASDMLFDFYENRVLAEGLSSKGFISPIASDALFYYKYKLLGTVVENDLLIHKIEVTPRRKSDPVFRGVIYIADSLWRLQNIDLYLTRDAGIEFLDTLRARQTFVPVSDSIWMPVTNRYDFSFKILGFAGGGNYVGYFSDFNLNPHFPKKMFSSEILRINQDANSKDINYWDSIRPIPLTDIEQVDYHRKDSLNTIRETKQYKDSMDRIYNKFSLINFLLTGYTYQHSYKKMYYSIKSIANTIAFNTAEGWNIALQADLIKRFENRTRINAFTNMRYGFSNQHYNVNGGVKYLYNRFNDGEVAIEGGTSVQELNANNPVKPFINTLYSLYGKKNYLKLYEKQYGRMSFGREWLNGFYATIAVEYGNRLALRNTTNYSWIEIKRDYTSNNPLMPESDQLQFNPYRYCNLGIKVEYSLFSKYITRPDRKIREESPWPVLLFEAWQGLDGVANSATDFLKIQYGFKHQIDFGMLGYVIYQANAYRFVQKSRVPYVDYFHFKGNQTWFSDFNADEFAYLDYYAYSSTQNTYTIHAEYYLNRFLTNKIPYFRKLKLNEIVGFHYINVKQMKPHYEFTFGLEKTAIARMDIIWSYSGNNKPVYGFRCGLKIGRP